MTNFELNIHSLSFLLINDCHGSSSSAASNALSAPPAATASHVPLFYIRFPTCRARVDAERSGKTRTDVSLQLQLNFYNLAQAQWVAVSDLFAVAVMIESQTVKLPLMVEAPAAPADTASVTISKAPAAQAMTPTSANKAQAQTQDEKMMEHALRLSEETYRQEQASRAGNTPTPNPSGASATAPSSAANAAAAPPTKPDPKSLAPRYIPSPNRSVVTSTLAIQIDVPTSVEVCAMPPLLCLPLSPSSL